MLRARLYLLHMIGGMVILITLGIHMVVQHLNNILAFFGLNDPNPTSWASMISRSESLSWVIIYVVLLAFLLYHMLYGLRGIILELTTSATAARVVTWSFIIGGFAIFAWGTYILVYLF